MPDTLVIRSIEQARDRDPTVKAMTLLYGSRVMAAMNRALATQIFAEGVASIQGIAQPGHQIEGVFNEAIRVGAFADPRAAVALFRSRPAEGHAFSRRSAGTMLVQSLAQSGDFESALELLEDLTCDVGGAQAVAHLASDPIVQRRAMSAARERWRVRPKLPDTHRGHFAEHEFFHLFSRQWRNLSPADQQSWLDEILHALGTGPNQETQAGFGETVTFHSTRDMHLFEILNVLRAIKPPDEVEAILRAYPDVAAAAQVYPLGLESLMAERRPVPEGVGGGFIFSTSGSSSDHRLVAAALAARRGDPAAVSDLLAEAHRLYLEDVDADDPNLAPRAFWPSSHAYRQAMYWAGERSGLAAEALLAQIPDMDLALLAAIELAAGTLGLPEHPGIRMEQHPNRHRRG